MSETKSVNHSFKQFKSLSIPKKKVVEIVNTSRDKRERLSANMFIARQAMSAIPIIMGLMPFVQLFKNKPNKWVQASIQAGLGVTNEVASLLLQKKYSYNNGKITIAKDFESLLVSQLGDNSHGIDLFFDDHKPYEKSNFLVKNSGKFITTINKPNIIRYRIHDDNNEHIILSPQFHEFLDKRLNIMEGQFKKTNHNRRILDATCSVLPILPGILPLLPGFYDNTGSSAIKHALGLVAINSVKSYLMAAGTRVVAKHQGKLTEIDSIRNNIKQYEV